MFFKAMDTCGNPTSSLSGLDKFGNLRQNISWSGIVDSSDRYKCAYQPMTIYFDTMNATACFR